MTSATIDVRIDWNDDGDYSDTGETVTTRVRASRGITTERGRDQLRSFAPPMAGAMAFDLDNATKDYSSQYGSSPLAASLYPGHNVRMQATHSSTTYTLFRGVLDDIEEHPWRTEKSVSLPCLGSLSKLVGKKVSTPLYQDITTDVAIGYVLNAVGWSASERALSTGKTTLTAWWLGDEDAFGALVDLLNAEGPGAALYERGDGYIVFEDRHYRLTQSRCLSAQSAFSDAGGSPSFSPPLDFQPNYKGVVNEVHAEAKTLTVAATTSTVWTCATVPFTVADNETKVIEIELSDPVTGLTTPNTGDVSIDYNEYYLMSVITEPTITLNRTSGTRIAISINNSNWDRAVTVKTLLLRGYATTTATETVKNSISTTTSQTRYGLRSLPSNLAPWPYVSRNVLKDWCDAMVLYYREPRPTATLLVKNRDGTNLTAQLAREISDRVTVTESQTALSSTAFFIERIRHEIRYGGTFHATEFGLERAINLGFGTYGSGVYDTAVYGF